MARAVDAKGQGRRRKTRPEARSRGAIRGARPTRDATRGVQKHPECEATGRTESGTAAAPGKNRRLTGVGTRPAEQQEAKTPGGTWRQKKATWRQKRATWRRPAGQRTAQNAQAKGWRRPRSGQKRRTPPRISGARPRKNEREERCRSRLWLFTTRNRNRERRSPAMGAPGMKRPLASPAGAQGCASRTWTQRSGGALSRTSVH